VFQGSSLGPLLYCVFANDLSLWAEGAVVIQYADDTQILVSGKKSEIQNVVAHMESVLASLDVWFRVNGLKVNAAKTQLMLLGSTAKNLRTIPDITIKFRDLDVLPVSEAKNLGLIFDRTLSWDAHVSEVTRRCYGILGGLSHLRGRLPPAVISALINSLVFSQIRYCISIYGNGTKKNLSRIQKIINYSAKVIFGRKKFDPASDLLKSLGWLSAENLTDYHTLCLTHKVRRNGEPEDLASGFTTVAEHRSVEERSTRQDDDLYVPFSNLNIGKRRFRCRAADLYNALPPELQQLPIPAFGRNLRRHLLTMSAAPD